GWTRVASSDPKKDNPRRRGGIMVTFRPELSEGQRRSALARLGLQQDPHFDNPFMTRLHPAKPLAAPGAPASEMEDQQLDAALQALRQDPSVQSAEADIVVSATFIPNDPLFPNLWGLHNTAQP